MSTCKFSRLTMLPGYYLLTFSFIDCDMFMYYIGGGVGHQDISEPEICDVETGKMEVDVDPQDVGSDGEGSSSEKDLSNEEGSNIGDDSDDEDIGDWDPDDDNGSYIGDDYDEF